MKIKVEKEFEEVITAMANFNLATMDLGAIIRYDGEGGLNHFEFVLSNRLSGTKGVSIIWNSFYTEKVINLIGSDSIKVLKRKEYDIVQEKWFVDKYGAKAQDLDEEDDSIEYPDKDEIEELKRQAQKNLCYVMAQNICEKLHDEIINNKEIDNKFYGDRDSNGDPIPTDRGSFTAGINGKLLISCIYQELDLAQEIQVDLKWKSLVAVSYGDIENALTTAKEKKQDVLIYNGKTPCNNDEEECSLDYVKIYITPEGEVKEHRQHTY